MARGKAAAQAANRRLAEALGRIAELEQQLNDQELKHKRAVQELDVELHRAHGMTSKGIKQLAAEHVEDERDRANAEVLKLRETYLDRVIAGVFALESLPNVSLDATTEQWLKIAEAFDVSIGQLLAGLQTAHGVPHGREVARTTNRLLTAKMAFGEAARNGEVAENPTFRQMLRQADRSPKHL